MDTYSDELPAPQPSDNEQLFTACSFCGDDRVPVVRTSPIWVTAMHVSATTRRLCVGSELPA